MYCNDDDDEMRRRAMGRKKSRNNFEREKKEIPKNCEAKTRGDLDDDPTW